MALRFNSEKQGNAELMESSLKKKKKISFSDSNSSS